MLRVLRLQQVAVKELLSPRGFRFAGYRCRCTSPLRRLRHGILAPAAGAMVNDETVDIFRDRKCSTSYTHLRSMISAVDSLQALTRQVQRSHTAVTCDVPPGTCHYKHVRHLDITEAHMRRSDTDEDRTSWSSTNSSNSSSSRSTLHVTSIIQQQCCT